MEDLRFGHGDWKQIETALRVGSDDVHLGQNTPSSRQAQASYEYALKELSWVVSKLRALLAERA